MSEFKTLPSLLQNEIRENNEIFSQESTITLTLKRQAVLNTNYFRRNLETDR